MSQGQQPRHATDPLDALRAPLPRTPAAPNGELRDDPEEDRDPVTKARMREAAARNLAAVEMLASGRYGEAVPLFEQALASCRSALGNGHPETMTVAGNLGVALLYSGNRRKGIKVISANVDDRSRLFGDDHPMTLAARNALAAAYRISGDADTAVALARHVVAQRTEVLGSTHADTLRSRMGLALSLAAVGDVSSAHRMIVSTINDAEESLGPDHPVTSGLLQSGVSHGFLQQEA